MKFFKCEDCGGVLVKAFCAGMKSEKPATYSLKEIVPNTTDAATEKHVPVVEMDGHKVSVKVGSVEHPMTPEHYITFICLETTGGFYVKKLKPESKPEAFFCIDNTETAVAVYEYCNLHGLWKTEL